MNFVCFCLVFLQKTNMVFNLKLLALLLNVLGNRKIFCYKKLLLYENSFFYVLTISQFTVDVCRHMSVNACFVKFLNAITNPSLSIVTIKI